MRRLIYVFVGHTCQTVHSLTLRLKYALTSTTLWASSADEKLILFLIFPRKQDLSSCFLGKTRKNISICRLLKSLPQVLSVKVHGSCHAKKALIAYVTKAHISLHAHIVWSGPSLSAYRLISIQTVCMQCQTLFSEKIRIILFMCRQRVVKATDGCRLKWMHSCIVPTARKQMRKFQNAVFLEGLHAQNPHFFYTTALFL